LSSLELDSFNPATKMLSHLIVLTLLSMLATPGLSTPTDDPGTSFLPARSGPGDLIRVSRASLTVANLEFYTDTNCQDLSEQISMSMTTACHTIPPTARSVKVLDSLADQSSTSRTHPAPPFLLP
jgi:hypothetical protein